MANNYLNWSNSLYFCELALMGGGNSWFAKYNIAYSANMTYIVPSMLS